ncbi:MAG TPA: DNA methylase [Candidatus Eisenbacteria bacterium]|nr:DNA methylase [Candidatus Eisenbacteria bacterium]
MRVLDLYCGAGGAGMGYANLGAEVTGWDIEPQRRYPFTFHRGSALEVLRDVAYVRTFDFVHASPPCKLQTAIRHTIRPGANRKHPVNLIPETRELLDAAGVPYVIENVPGADLIDPIILCGSMFPGLFVRRHRLFETGGWKIAEQPACDHKGQDARSPGFIQYRYHKGYPTRYTRTTVGVYGGGNGGGPGEVAKWRTAMGIDWMVRDELTQAIPPRYTEWIFRKFLER